MREPHPSCLSGTSSIQDSWGLGEHPRVLQDRDGCSPKTAQTSR